MISIKGTTITMNRSDSVFITVTVRDAQGGIYDLQENDTLYFSAKRKSTDPDYAISPKPLVGNVLEITTEDTEQLAFGTYIYDVRLVTTRQDGTKYSTTIIKPSSLIIEESITSVGDY